MITVYTTSSCTACRQALKWFTENNILYTERKISSDEPFTKAELKKLLQLTENGWNDLICKRSNVYRSLTNEFGNYSIEYSMEVVIANPSMLKKPIITNNKIVRAGVNSTVLRSFIPRNRRKQYLIQYYINDLDSI